MNKLKLIAKSAAIVLALFFTTPMLHAAVIIEGPDETFHFFPDIDCCEDWGTTPPGWDCFDNC